MTAKTMRASEFKAKCLAVMNEVRDKRTTVTITKNGKPVAQMVPIKAERDPIFGFFQHKGRIVGDITESVYNEHQYEEFFHRKAAMYAPAQTTVSK